MEWVTIPDIGPGVWLPHGTGRRLWAVSSALCRGYWLCRLSSPGITALCYSELVRLSPSGVWRCSCDGPPACMHLQAAVTYYRKTLGKT